MVPVFEHLRRHYHESICREILGYRSSKGDKWLSVADKASLTSRLIAERVKEKMGYPLSPNPPTGQRAGALFVKHTATFLENAFEKLHHLRPGEWTFSLSQQRPGIARFQQYEHLAVLEQLSECHSELKILGSPTYLITPDLVVARHPVDDSQINAYEGLVDAGPTIARLTPLRKTIDPQSLILHASISCKWTMRSDRAQNTRTEALNLIRNRKGQTPHIVAVTFEPMATRLASIALGTGDIDCTYHAALHELLDAVNDPNEPQLESERELLNTLVEGGRLRDISDLPFDLAT